MTIDDDDNYTNLQYEEEYDRVSLDNIIVWLGNNEGLRIGRVENEKVKKREV